MINFPTQIPDCDCHSPVLLDFFFLTLVFVQQWLSLADWDGLCDHLRDVPWEDVFKLGASDTAIKFCEWVQV